MTDITKALRELPPMPELPVKYVSGVPEYRANTLVLHVMAERDALRARLTIAERLLHECAEYILLDSEIPLQAIDARAYLAHRAKETT